MCYIIKNIDFKLDYEELISNLGVDLDDEDDLVNFKYLYSQSSKIGSPKIIYKESVVQAFYDNSIVIDGVEFCSSALRNNLSDVKRCYPYIVTCGCEIDKIELNEISPLFDFWKDEVKARLLTAARKFLNKAIYERFHIENLASMAPGSADVDVWLVQEQKKLFSLFANCNEKIGVELTDTCLMLPNKTLSGIAFESSKEFLSCQLCQRKECVDRKIAFDESLYQIMNKNK